MGTTSTQETIYAETIISVLTNQGRWAPVTAKIGQQGLGYYLANDGYVVTSLSTGYAIVRLGYLTLNALAARNEQLLHRFISQITPLIPWTGTQEEITAQAKKRYPGGIFYEFRRIFAELEAEEAQKALYKEMEAATTDKGPSQVKKAMVNEESGLAYYWHSEQRGYIITALPSGYSVATTGMLTLYTKCSSREMNEQVVQRYTTLLAPLFDWKQDAATLLSQCRKRYSGHGYGSPSREVLHVLSDLLQQAYDEVQQEQEVTA